MSYEKRYLKRQTVLGQAEEQRQQLANQLREATVKASERNQVQQTSTGQQTGSPTDSEETVTPPPPLDSQQTPPTVTAAAIKFSANTLTFSTNNRRDDDAKTKNKRRRKTNRKRSKMVSELTENVLKKL